MDEDIEWLASLLNEINDGEPYLDLEDMEDLDLL